MKPDPVSSLGLAAVSAVGFYYAPRFAGEHAGSVRLLCAFGVFAGVASAFAGSSGSLGDELVKKFLPSPPNAKVENETELPPAASVPAPVASSGSVSAWFVTPSSGSVVRRRTLFGNEYEAVVDLQNDGADAEVDLSITTTETDVFEGEPSRASFGRVFVAGGSRKRLTLSLVMQTEVIVTLPSADCRAVLEIDGKATDAVSYYLR